jgi:hypothetical protein
VTSRRVRIAIYGSCVSRDMVETWPADQYELLVYIARQSLLSAGTNARSHFPEPIPLSSEFQRRNIESDLRGDLVARLTAVADRTDLLLWDLTDERHGCVRFPDGTCATCTVESLGSAPLKAALEAGTHLQFGSGEHFRAWAKRAEDFVTTLSEHRLLDRTLVLAVPWAERDRDGRPAPWSMGQSASTANRRFQRYHAHLESLGLPLARVDEPTFDPNHKWGPAPFHYEPWVYADLRRKVLSSLSQAE